MRYAVVHTPLGPLTVASTPKGLAAVQFGASKPKDGVEDEGANHDFIRQLEEYFEGRRTDFDAPLDVAGTPFQMAVWNELQRIPYGETRTYGEIAARIGRPGAARAVGMANHDNPIAVVIPCHRVIGGNGSLTGYAGGLHLKQKLLSLERRAPLFT
ncbi:MAG TPA: methylated-DNA--[protein]-cysteine S-methyltransferase [Terriglobia bacterium]|nr:methylated-DNA--[protein]-cysteine S-methyltransferase [Terriglobia bacterium]